MAARHEQPGGGRGRAHDAGVSVAQLIPNPWLFLEATGQVFRGDSGTVESPLYQTSQRGQLSYVAHLRGYQDLSESTNLDVGVSWSRGYNGSGLSQGVDASDHAAAGLRRDTAVEAAAALDLPLVRRPLGGHLEPSRAAERSAERYGLLRLAYHQLARRWFAGVRFDGKIGLALRLRPSRHRRLGPPDILAERVQPDPRP